ncbi:classical arabinogalactan protein 9-like [Phoenix dactylifera]|uniref:Protein transport protein SEC23 n=1 Tax=Phoenix dactylifera TaxID=42345 RepID=A0A8B9A720_PHODC|nr:classical arabinogalactan protein 9-like [Phoenix dactylifera]XP_038979677.1 classical arabinogalactan protein 9-like [Phoenix dactylifera]XP_038979680.1 classical arabinogalactan protein 9-like [Phoenix dactylifera]
MDTTSPPPHPGYTAAVASPSTPTPRPERRPTPPAFSSPVTTRFSPQRPPYEQPPLSSSRTPSSLSSGDGAQTGSSPVPQFSNPPGPPIFTSPLRPAAVPFRTSPATPQPVPFSSGSSLPTSSPPLYSNGSYELPVHHAAGVDDSSFESPYVLFSAHKVLKHKKLANVPSLGFGALVSPGREIAPGPEVVQRDPHRCQTCGAFANLYSEILIGSGQWQCVICKKLNSSDGEYIASSKEDIRHWPELSSSAIDYVHTGNKRPGYTCKAYILSGLGHQSDS